MKELVQNHTIPCHVYNTSSYAYYKLAALPGFYYPSVPINLFRD